MEQTLKYSVGIDISKDTFHASIISINEQRSLVLKASHSFDNKPFGFKDFEKWIKKHCKQIRPSNYTMEATGVYYEALAWYLYAAKESVAVVLPNKAKNYMLGIGYKTKNDKIDSKGLAQLGAEQKLRVWQPLSMGIAKLRSFTRQHESLARLRIAAMNQLHACQHSAYEVKEVIRQLKNMIKYYEQQLAIIVKAIQKTVDTDPNLKERFEHICAIKGLSLLSLATIVAETNGFALMHNKRQLTSYAGYDVIQNQSGNHTGRTKISKKGNYRIRRILHMPALVAVKHESLFCQLYERVYETSGIKMKGYVAVQRKLLQLIYHLWKNNQPFIRQFKNTSVNDEPKLLFPLYLGSLEKESSPSKVGLH